MTPESPSLKSKLPHQVHSGGARWHCDSSIQSSTVDRWTTQIEAPADLGEDQILKRAPRRLVFANEQAVIKAFPLRGWRRWSGRRGYAHAECAHLLEAANRGLPVPQCLAYGERPSLGGCRWNAVAQERIPSPTLRDAWLAHPEAIDVSATLERLVPLAGQLYHAGVNHIDFGPHAVIMSEDRTVVIDWQYAAFLSEANPLVFASQIGYFAWATATNRSWATPDQMRDWFDTLWETHAIPKRDAAEKVFRRTLERRFSISERLAAQETFAG